MSSLSLPHPGGMFDPALLYPLTTMLQAALGNLCGFSRPWVVLGGGGNKEGRGGSAGNILRSTPHVSVGSLEPQEGIVLPQIQSGRAPQATGAGKFQDSPEGTGQRGPGKPQKPFTFPEGRTSGQLAANPQAHVGSGGLSEIRVPAAQRAGAEQALTWVGP